jgi:hypothetical protein
VDDQSDLSSEDIGTNVPDSHVAELAKVNALRPSMAEFKGKPGYREEKLNERGDFKPHYGFVMNYGDGRGPTKEAQEFAEAMRPFNRASAAFQAKTQAGITREAMVDAAGNRQYVEPHLAPEAARMNGWKPASRIVGLLARRVHGDFCPRCDRLKAWCECLGRSGH